MPKIPEWSMENGDLKMFETLFKHDDKNVDKDTIECYKYTFSKPGQYNFVTMLVLHNVMCFCVVIYNMTQS